MKFPSRATRIWTLCVLALGVIFALPAVVHADQDAQGPRLENFMRVETFGDNVQNGVNDVQWLKVIVDPKSREVFSYQAQIVPGNRVAVPAP